MSQQCTWNHLIDSLIGWLYFQIFLVVYCNLPIIFWIFLLEFHSIEILAILNLLNFLPLQVNRHIRHIKDHEAPSRDADNSSRSSGAGRIVPASASRGTSSRPNTADTSRTASEEDRSRVEGSTPDYVIHYQALYYLFRFGSSLGYEAFYATFFPVWTWNIDGAVCRYGPCLNACSLCMYWTWWVCSFAVVWWQCGWLLCKSTFDWLIDWLADRLFDWFFHWLIDWLGIILLFFSIENPFFFQSAMSSWNFTSQESFFAVVIFVFCYSIPGISASFWRISWRCRGRQRKLSSKWSRCQFRYVFWKDFTKNFDIEWQKLVSNVGMSANMECQG